MRIFPFILSIFFATTFCHAQIIYGQHQYTELHIGSLPVIISVPHGGSLQPNTIPDRVCNSAVTVADANTIELSQAIDSAFEKNLGCKPYLIISNLHRAKLDCNRNLADAACANTDAEIAWNEFHHFIDTAQLLASSQWNDRVLYIDLHGHGNPIQRIELGYLLYDNELDFTDSILNTAQYISYSTIQNLVSNNQNNYAHAELLRGAYSFGTLLGISNYPAVPSSQIPSPGITSNYYSGGYNVAHHSSYAVGNHCNGFQMECNYTGIRDTYQARKAFADTLVHCINTFLFHHQALQLQLCHESYIEEKSIASEIIISPNPVKTKLNIFVKNNAVLTKASLYNTIGEVVRSQSNSNSINLGDLPMGVYGLEIKVNDAVYYKKICVEP